MVTPMCFIFGRRRANGNCISTKIQVFKLLEYDFEKGETYLIHLVLMSKLEGGLNMPRWKN